MSKINYTEDKARETAAGAGLVISTALRAAYCDGQADSMATATITKAILKPI